MGDLGAIHEDVRFDWAKASELAGQFRVTASVLESQVGERNGTRGVAREHWRGRFAEEFDGRMNTCVRDAAQIAVSMQEAARQLEEMARLAREEQARRERAREWEASQDSGGGILGWAADRVDDVHDIFAGEDDLPPPPPPVDPPIIGIEAPVATAREG